MNILKVIEQLKKSTKITSITKYYKKNSNKIKIWAVVLVAGGMTLKGFMQIPTIVDNKMQIDQLKQQIEYEQERIQEVEHLKEIADTDEYIEKIAREKLGLIKSNEKIYIDVSKQDK